MTRVQELYLRFYPEPVLRRPAEPIERVSEEVRAIGRRMIELMHESRGVGLAGPQVGVGRRLFVANPTGDAGGDRIFINPVLRELSRATDRREEGCLSIPAVNAEITRSVTATIDALDEHGRPFTLTEEGLAARIWQHETDHLDGTLILDRMTPLDRQTNRRAVKELERHG